MWEARNIPEAIGARVRAAARIIAAFVASAFIVSNAVAQNLGTFFTDDWWNPDESGWGLVVMHQQTFIFATFFIYKDGAPYWVTAHLEKVGTSGLAASPQVFTGPVYETQGTPFGTPWNPNSSGQTQVGTATFSSTGSNTATLQYSINGVNVTKNIQRQTLRYINYSAQYGGGTVYQFSQCVGSASSNNGATVSDTGLLTIAQTNQGQTFHMDAVGQVNNCSFNGTYTQRGSLGRVDGNYSCLNGEVGTFTMFAMQWTLYGMSAGITGQNQFCHFDGFLGGITGLHIVP